MDHIFPLLTLGLILLGLSAEAAAAADDLPRNIELKPGLFGHFANVDVTELAPTPQILALIKGKSDAVCLASGEGHPPVGEGAPPPEHALAHHGGGY